MAERDSWAVGATADRRVGAEDARLGVGALLAAGTTPITTRGALRLTPGSPGLVQATGTPGINVTVNSFQGAINASRGAGPYLVTLDATKTVAILDVPADPSNQRNDLIIAQQSDVDYGDATRDMVVKRVLGTASGTPADPTVTGSPDYILLARVRVAAGALTIDNAHIDDLRPGWMVAIGGILPVASQTVRDALTGTRTDGMAVYRQDRDWVEIWDTTAFRVQGIAVCASTADRDSAITAPYSGQFAFTTDTATLWRYTGSTWLVYPNKPSFQLRNTAAQSIANITFAALLFDTEDNDSDNGHSTSSNTDRYTIPLAGLWEFNGGGSSVGNATGTRICRLTKGGTVVAGSGHAQAASDAGNFSIVGCRPTRIQCALNDIIRVEYWQNSGGALNTGTTDYAQPSFSGHWIRP